MKHWPSYAWPGGYPIYYHILNDGDSYIACPDCANKHWRHVVGQGINFEDPKMYCEDCGKNIECAYIANVLQTFYNVFSK